MGVGAFVVKLFQQTLDKKQGVVDLALRAFYTLATPRSHARSHPFHLFVRGRMVD